MSPCRPRPRSPFTRLLLSVALLFSLCVWGAHIPVTVRAAAGGSTLSTNETLTAGQWLTSGPGASAVYRLMLTDTGALIVQSVPGPASWPAPTTMWNAGAATSASNTLEMQPDCNLVLYSGIVALWASNTRLEGIGCYLIMQQDGNAVVYNEAGQALWATNTDVTSGTQPAGAVLTPLRSLSAGQFLQSENALYRFMVDAQGAVGVLNMSEAVQHSPTTVWMTATSSPSPLLVMQPNCTLALYTQSSTSNSTLWSSGTTGWASSCYAVMRDDGNLVLYSSTGEPLWSPVPQSPAPPGMIVDVVQLDSFDYSLNGWLMIDSGGDTVILVQNAEPVLAVFSPTGAMLASNVGLFAGLAVVWGLGLDGQDNIYVLGSGDYAGDVATIVITFSPDAVAVAAFYVDQSLNVEYDLIDPLFAVDNGSSLYIAQTSTVVKMSSNGDVLAIFSGLANDGKFTALTVDGAGNIYVASAGASSGLTQIAVLSPAGVVSLVIPTTVNYGANTMAVDSLGNLYFHQAPLSGIWVVNPAGQQLYMIDKNDFGSVVSMALDGQGNVYAMDSTSNDLVVLASLLYSWSFCFVTRAVGYVITVQAILTTSQDGPSSINGSAKATAVSATGQRTFVNLTTGETQFLTIFALAPPDSTGGNDNVFFPQSQPALDPWGLTFVYTDFPVTAGQGANPAAGMELNYWWDPSEQQYVEGNGFASPDQSVWASSVSFAVSNAVTLPSCSPQPACSATFNIQSTASFPADIRWPACTSDLYSYEPIFIATQLWMMGGLQAGSTLMNSVFSSVNGFTDYSSSSYPGSAAAYAGAAYLQNGNLLFISGKLDFGGLSSSWSPTVYWSADRGATFSVATSAAPFTPRSDLCSTSVPMTNIALICGGQGFVDGQVTALSDCWLSRDGSGAEWSQQVAVGPFGAYSSAPCVALFDAQPSLGIAATFVLTTQSSTYYVSYDYAMTFAPRVAPWASAVYTQMATDVDSVVYINMQASNALWLSVDKAQTWQALTVPANSPVSFQSQSFASCLAVTYVHDASTGAVTGKRLVMYGGFLEAQGAYPAALQGTVAVNCSVTAWALCAVLQGLDYVSTVQAILTSSSGSPSVYNGVPNAYRAVGAVGQRSFFSNESTGVTQQVLPIIAVAPAGSLVDNDNYFFPQSQPALDGSGLTFVFTQIPDIADATGSSSPTTQLNLRWDGSRLAYAEQNANNSNESRAWVSSLFIAPTELYSLPTCSPLPSAQLSFCLTLQSSRYAVVWSGVLTTTAAGQLVVADSSNRLPANAMALQVLSATGTRVFTNLTTGAASEQSIVAVLSSFLGNDNFLYPEMGQLADRAGIAFQMDNEVPIAGHLSNDSRVLVWYNAGLGKYLESTASGQPESTPVLSSFTVQPYGGGALPACDIVGPPTQPGSVENSDTCGAFGVSLPLSGVQLSITVSGVTYYHAPCGLVTAVAACGNSSSCQQQKKAGVAYSLAANSNSDGRWLAVSPSTIVLLGDYSGDYCDAVGEDRTVNVVYSCTPQFSTRLPKLVNASEPTTCHYLLEVLYYSATCNAGPSYSVSSGGDFGLARALGAAAKPPVFDANFTADPASKISPSIGSLALNYGWLTVDTTDTAANQLLHQGLAVLSGGPASWINVSAATGPNSCGLLAPLIGGPSSSESAAGWSFEFVWKPTSLPSGSAAKLLDLGNGPAAGYVSPAADDWTLGFDGSDDPQFLMEQYNSATPQYPHAFVQVGAGLAAGQWYHMAVVQQPSGAVGAASWSVYVNGQLQLWAANLDAGANVTVTPAQGANYPQPVSRPFSYIGKSDWSNDANLAAVIDAVRIYDYALSQKQITALANLYDLNAKALLYPTPGTTAPGFNNASAEFSIYTQAGITFPPVFNAPFATNPASLVGGGTSYKWRQQDPADVAAHVAGYHQGLITLSGSFPSYVDLTQVKGPQSIGQSLPLLFGASSGVRSLGTYGWSIDVVVKPHTVGASAALFDLGSGAGIDSLYLGWQGKQAWVIGSYITVENSLGGLSSFISNSIVDAVLGQWYHVAWVMQPRSTDWQLSSSKPSTVANWTVYVNGVSTLHSTKGNTPLPVFRHLSSLGLSEWFDEGAGAAMANATYDAFRVWDRALTASQVLGLTRAYGLAGASSSSSSAGRAPYITSSSSKKSKTR